MPVILVKLFLLCVSLMACSSSGSDEAAPTPTSAAPECAQPCADQSEASVPNGATAPTTRTLPVSTGALDSTLAGGLAGVDYDAATGLFTTFRFLVWMPE